MVSSMNLQMPPFLRSSKMLVKIVQDITSRKKFCWIYLDRLYGITLCFHITINFVKVSIILGCAEKAILACINLDLLLP